MILDHELGHRQMESVGVCKQNVKVTMEQETSTDLVEIWVGLNHEDDGQQKRRTATSETDNVTQVSLVYIYTIQEDTTRQKTDITG